MKIRIPARPLLLAACVSLLSACGSDGSDSTANPPPTYTGTLTDSAVAGIAYTTSSGLSGLTDADGHFNYQPGDTVTFSLGSMPLGSLQPVGTAASVTPLELAAAQPGVTEATRQNLVTNLLVLLQSVDADGDPSNGISIPSDVTSLIDTGTASALQTQLAADPATFQSSSTLSSLNTASGSGVGPVSPTAALEHFRLQFLAKLKGVYSFTQGSNLITFRFDDQGHYVHSQVGPSEVVRNDQGVIVYTVGESGIEAGTIDWNPLTGEVTPVGSVTVDTNLEWGLSHMWADEHLYFHMDGDALLIQYTAITSGGTVDAPPTLSSGGTRVYRTPLPEDSLIGTWSLDSTDIGAVQIQFLADGHALVQSQAATSGCGEAGVEWVNYSTANGVLTFSNATTDTNGCEGVHDDTVTGSSAYLSTAYAFNANGSVSLGANGTLYRYDSTALQ